jgi:hypothetical protein
MRYFNDVLNKFDRLMAAVTFAEADEPVTALRFLEETPRKRKASRKDAEARAEERKRPVLRV